MKFISELIGRHLIRYPLMEPADIYKLLHQAAMGNGHLPPPEAARERLIRELEETATGPDEPLIDPISPDGRLVRVHLRAFKARGLDAGLLLDAFGRTAATWPPEAGRLQRFCVCLGDMAEGGHLPFLPVRVHELLADMSSQEYPALHHSAAYRAAYGPAYRVVDHTLLPSGW